MLDQSQTVLTSDTICLYTPQALNALQLSNCYTANPLNSLGDRTGDFI